MDSRAAPAGHRAFVAALMALALALRLLSPAGFMPAFDRGEVTIVACPDAEPMAKPAAMAMAHHHHHDGGKAHQQPCPYAAASATGPLPWDAPAVLASPTAPEVVRAAAVPDTLAATRDRERPPATGPPALPA